MTDLTDDLWDDMTPDSLRERAAEADQRAADSWERSDTDGFLSQWAHGITADRDRAQARLIEQGGTARFRALFTTAGEWVPARQIEGQWGPRWLVLTPEGRSTGRFLTYAPKRRNTLAQRGYVEGWVLRPAQAVIAGSGRGLSGAASCYVALEPTDEPHEQPAAILTTDRWERPINEEVQA